MRARARVGTTPPVRRAAVCAAAFCVGAAGLPASARQPGGPASSSTGAPGGTSTGAPTGQDREAGRSQTELPYAPAEAIAPYVDLLNVEDFSARLNAAEWIYETPSITLETITPWLMNPALSPEARSRLEAIGDVLFRVTSRGAMGVQFERQGVAPIIIRNALDDNAFFRAHEVLDAGDEVVMADGEPVRTYDEFQGAILSHDPYETMNLRIRRAGELLDVAVPLGDYMRLGNGTIPADQVMRLAWERRLARIRASMPEPMTPTLDCRDDTARPLPGDEPSGQRGLGDRLRGSLVVAGGLARGGVDQDGDPIEAAALEMDDEAVEVRDFLRQRGMADADIQNFERQLAPLRAAQARLVEIRQHYRDQIAAIAGQLNDATLDPTLRRELSERLARLNVSLGDTQLQIDQINNVLPGGR